MYEDNELLALSGLQHIAYCERQWALIHVERMWEDSSDTIRGVHFHERVDTSGYVTVRGVRAERGVHVVSRRLGLYGIADIVEYGKDGQLLGPVEYKVGKPKMDDWDRLQVAAQALCLEEMKGAHIIVGSLFYGETRRRESIQITGKLRLEVERLSETMHRLFENGKTPVASVGTKCRRCSLHHVCLPEAQGKNVDEYWRNWLKPWGTHETSA